MIFEGINYSKDYDFANATNDAVFQHCTFNQLNINGKAIDAIFLTCSFANVEWYWGIFNSSLFTDTRIENCVFYGTSFAGCRFLNCQFVNCRFEKDNLGADCTFDNSKFFDCSFKDSNLPPGIK